MDREAWWATVHGVDTTEQLTLLSQYLCIDHQERISCLSLLRYADDTTLMAESEEELKSVLMKVKEESEKVGLNLNIQKNKIMASGPITSWQIDGETLETVADFIFLGSKITADVIAAMKLKYTCSLEGKL